MEFGGLLFLIPVAVLVAGAFARARRESHRLELQKTIIERVGSVKDFAEFLASDAGKQFLGAVQPEATNPHMRLLWAIRTGIVMTTVGTGLLIGQINNMFWTINMNVVAILLLAGGVGMLIAAVISYRLAKRLGIVEDEAPLRRDTATR